MKARILFLIAAALCVVAVTASGQLYWKIDSTTGLWTGNFWGTSSSGPFTSAWVGGKDVVFQVKSATTFASTTVGNVTVNDGGYTVTVTAGGTLTTSSISIIYVGTGDSLIWTGQTMASSNGFTKSGSGVWSIGSLTSAYTGGFTLNAGTVSVTSTGTYSLGGGALTINSGTLSSTGTKTFACTSITIGGDFINSGTGNSGFGSSCPVSIGSSTRTITNSTTSGSRQYLGVISGSGGLTFSGTGSAQTYLGNSGNLFSGPITITGGEVVFNDNGSLGRGTSITLDGGRLTISSMATDGTTTALTSATIGSGFTIYVGSTAGTSLSIQGSTGVTAFNGVIADKPSSTGAWAKQGAGTLQLGGVSTYTGNTAINNGTLKLTTGDNRLPVTTVVSVGQAASTNLGTFDLNGYSQEIAGLVSTAGSNTGSSKNTVTSSSTATLTISGGGTYSYGAGATQNSGIISGSILLVKTGSGTQTLGDANTYTGSTTISGGTLKLSYSSGNTIPATNSIVINGGGTLKVSSNQTVNNLTLNSGGTLTIDDGVTLTWTGSYTNNGGTVNGGGTILPVEMTSFTAVAQNMSAFLAWSTATEVNNYGFDVERGTMLNTALTMQWQKIGFVQGAGTSNAPHEYSFTDKNIPSGRYDYRLKQIDRDGLFKYSQSVEVEVENAPHAFSLSQNYPDPFNPTTTINYSLPSDEKVRLAVYDILGNEVGVLVNGEQTAGSYQAAFSGANLASGIYFYKLESSGQTIIKKMILLK
jgi:autotransporter-associated beta strand protein